MLQLLLRVDTVLESTLGGARIAGDFADEARTLSEPGLKLASCCECHHGVNHTHKRSHVIAGENITRSLVESAALPKQKSSCRHKLMTFYHTAMIWFANACWPKVLG